MNLSFEFTLIMASYHIDSTENKIIAEIAQLINKFRKENRKKPIKRNRLGDVASRQILDDGIKTQQQEFGQL